MSFVKLFYMILLSIAFISCGENAGDKIDFTLNTNATNNKISINNINFKLVSENSTPQPITFSV